MNTTFLRIVVEFGVWFRRCFRAVFLGKQKHEKSTEKSTEIRELSDQNPLRENSAL